MRYPGLSGNRIQVQADVDERDLGRVVKCTYAFVALIAISAVLPILGIVHSAAHFHIFQFVFSTIWIISLALFAWANIKSAKAIAAREEAHFSYFIAGMDMMVVFPLGILLSMYTWRVLSRPSVRDLYADPYRAPSLPPQKQADRPKPTDRNMIEPKIDTTNLDDLEESIWRQMEIEHNKKRSGEALDKIKLKPADDET